MEDSDLSTEGGPGLRTAETLSRKIGLLLETLIGEDGKPYNYPTVCHRAQAAGFCVSRERWDRLKAGKEQSLPEEFLQALAGVFGVNSQYLLQEDGPLSERVEAELILLRSMRRAKVRDFGIRALRPLDANAFRAVAKIVDEIADEHA